MNILSILENLKNTGFKNIREKRFYDLKLEIQNYPQEKIALYGTGNHTRLLLDYINDVNIDIIGLIDIDKNKIGKTIHGHKVYDINQLIGKVDIIIISSDVYQEIIYKRIKYLKEKDVKIIKIYKKEDLHDTERTYFHDDDELGVKAANYYNSGLLSHINRYMWALSFVHNKHVMDIACGCGYGTQIFSEHARTVVGVDIDKTTIKYANKYFKSDNISYICSDINNLNLKNEFDVVVSFETIEHIQDESRYIDQIKKCLKEEGIFIVSTPVALKDGANNKYNPYHVNEYTENRFVEFLCNNFNKVRFYVQDENNNGAISFKEAFGDLNNGAYNIIAVCYNQK